MARIRSIKPDFFTSETIAALPLSARLTFIGLWTHVDDNGVTVDNARLIVAAIWPLEEDPREALQRTQEDLQRLSEAGLIQRYESDGRQLLFITAWDEHQKVSHPGKTRYPRPTPNALTSGNTKPPEVLPKSSGESTEILRPEQGAGSREQGSTRAPARRSAARNYDDDPRFVEFWNVYPLKKAKPAAFTAWRNAIKRGADPGHIITAAKSYRDDPRRKPDFTAHPATWLNQERYDDQPAVTPPVIGGSGGAWWDN
ncbi:hypothetical protein [Micromonospora globbae]|uniref:hypothetical protein n=1 Tax=Micromonospora globbae TaxID=1894969 RepID=UPI0013157EEF|nr:hypothetical protein [Micromonospora globbae]